LNGPIYESSVCPAYPANTESEAFGFGVAEASFEFCCCRIMAEYAIRVCTGTGRPLEDTVEVGEVAGQAARSKYEVSDNKFAIGIEGVKDIDDVNPGVAPGAALAYSG